MPLYNYSFDVKYKSIENELKEKHDENSEYTIENVENICNELYQQELLNAFGFDDESEWEDNSERQEQMYDELWEVFSAYDSFHSFLQKFKEKYKETLECINIYVEDEDKNEDEKFNKYVLPLLFSYETFHSFHKCIKDVYTLNCITDENMNLLLESVL
jgi:hypothetical protein